MDDFRGLRDEFEEAVKEVEEVEREEEEEELDEEEEEEAEEAEGAEEVEETILREHGEGRVAAEVPATEVEQAKEEEETEKEEALAGKRLETVSAEREREREREIRGCSSWATVGVEAQGVSLQTLPRAGGSAEAGTAERSRTSALPLNDTSPLNETRPCPRSYPAPHVSPMRTHATGREDVHSGAKYQGKTRRNGEQADAVWMARDDESGRVGRNEAEGRREGVDVRPAIDSEWEEASERERERERLERRRVWER